MLVLGAAAPRAACCCTLQALGGVEPHRQRVVALLDELPRTCPRAGPTSGGTDLLPGLPAFDVVINATSASLSADAPAAPPQAFAPGGLAYDMAYGKGLTPSCAWRESAPNVRVADGVGMLVEQAAEAFAWWRACGRRRMTCSSADGAVGL